MGFIAKWNVLQAALEQNKNYLAIWLVITSVVSAGYYLYVVMVMFMRARPHDAPVLAATPGATRFIIAATAALILFFGIFPQPVLRFARDGTLQSPSVVAPTTANDVPVAAAPAR
jgi:NADH-quinone oxidoreductase subunit N